MVMATECGYYVDVEVADDPPVKEKDAESVFRTCRHSVGRSVDANSVETDESFGLQANAFVTGAVALMHVRDDNRFIDSLKSSVYGFFTNTDDLEKWIQANRSLHDYADAADLNVCTSSEYKNVDGGSHE